jgi:ribonucleoside-diphosphate reductase alpha chain
LVEAASRRQKWIDQAQSLNIYMAGASGKKLDDTYKLAWLRGLKTTYYLRTIGATHTEKSTSKAGALNAVDSGAGKGFRFSAPRLQKRTARHACCVQAMPDFEECEACQ